MKTIFTLALIAFMLPFMYKITIKELKYKDELGMFCVIIFIGMIFVSIMAISEIFIF